MQNNPTLADCLKAGASGVMMPCEHYHQLPGISASSLQYLQESNRHFDNRKNFSSDSDALRFGNLVHTATLEPDELDKRYVAEPKFDGRSNAGKLEKQAFHEDNKHRIVVPYDDYIKATRMALNAYAICHEIIDAGIIERSLFSDYGNGIILKCRLDIESPTGDDFDLKTISPKHGMSDHELLRHSLQFNYPMGCAFRNIVRRSLGIETGDSYLIFVSTLPGYMIKVRRVTPELIKQGERICLSLLESRKEYLIYGYDVEPKTIEQFN